MTGNGIYKLGFVLNSFAEEIIQLEYGVLFLQELSSSGDAFERKATCMWLAAIKLDITLEGFAFFAPMEDDSLGRVGIFLKYPRKGGTAVEWRRDKWNASTIGVEWRMAKETLHLVNVYVPVSKKVQEGWFSHFCKQWITLPQLVIFGGDWNTVLDGTKDRSTSVGVGGVSSGVIQDIILDWQLKEGLVDLGLMAGVQEKEVQPAHTHFYPQGSSRLDRFYVSGDFINSLEWRLRVDLERKVSTHGELQVWVSERKGAPPKGSLTQWVFPTSLLKDHVFKKQVYLEKLTWEANRHIGGSASQEWTRFCQNMQRLAKRREAVVRIASRQAGNLRKTEHRKAAQQHQLCPSQLTWVKLQENKVFVPTGLGEEAKQKLGQKMIRGDHFSDSYHKKYRKPRGVSQVTTMRDKDGEIEEDVNKLPGVLADYWKTHIFQKNITQTTDNYEQHIERFLENSKLKLTEQEKASMEQPIQREELRAIWKMLKRGKSPGEDGLTGGFFRAYREELEPMVWDLFKEINATGVLPHSFKRGVLAMLPKAGDSPDPRNYRPIALLTVVSKIFTKIFAQRLKNILPRLVPEHQYGFVQGRRVNDAVAVVKEALRQSAKKDAGPVDTTAMVVLLDFAKAYDTVDHRFLVAVLRKMGFGGRFCALMQELHRDLKVCLKLNGRLSTWIHNWFGIRQGDPLAPLLFILIMSILLEVIEGNSRLKGQQLQLGTSIKEVKGVAFVDDLTLLVRYAKDLGLFLGVLDDFAQVSGLEIQPAKCVVIWGHASIKLTQWDSHTERGVVTMTCQVGGETPARLLGTLVGVGVTPEVVWRWVIQKLQQRLFLASGPGGSLRERAMLIGQLVAPVIRFHCMMEFPTEGIRLQLTQIIRSFVWKMKTSAHKGIRGGVALWILELPLWDGGLNVCNVDQLLQQCSVTMLIRVFDNIHTVWAQCMIQGSERLLRCSKYGWQPGSNGLVRLSIPKRLRNGLELGDRLMTGIGWVPKACLQRKLVLQGLDASWWNNYIQYTCGNMSEDEDDDYGIEQNPLERVQETMVQYPWQIAAGDVGRILVWETPLIEWPEGKGLLITAKTRGIFQTLQFICVQDFFAHRLDETDWWPELDSRQLRKVWFSVETAITWTQFMKEYQKCAGILRINFTYRGQQDNLELQVWEAKQDKGMGKGQHYIVEQEHQRRYYWVAAAPGVLQDKGMVPQGMQKDLEVQVKSTKHGIQVLTGQKFRGWLPIKHRQKGKEVQKDSYQGGTLFTGKARQRQRAMGRRLERISKVVEAYQRAGYATFTTKAWERGGQIFRGRELTGTGTVQNFLFRVIWNGYSMYKGEQHALGQDCAWGCGERETLVHVIWQCSALGEGWQKATNQVQGWLNREMSKTVFEVVWSSPNISIPLGVAIQGWWLKQTQSPASFLLDMERGIQEGIRLLWITWAQCIWKWRCERVFRGVGVPNWEDCWYAFWTTFGAGLGSSIKWGRKHWSEGFRWGVQQLLVGKVAETRYKIGGLHIWGNAKGTKGRWVRESCHQPVKSGCWAGTWIKGVKAGMEAGKAEHPEEMRLTVDRVEWAAVIQGKSRKDVTRKVWQMLGKYGIPGWSCKVADGASDREMERIEGWMEYGEF
jgi:hypothetical protein